MNIKLQGNWVVYSITALVSLLAFGFPSIAYISLTLGVPSTPIAILYRFILVLISMSLIIHSIAKTPIRISWGAAFLIVFWIVYIIRLIYDLVIVDIQRDSNLSPFYVFSFAIGNCFLPIIAIVLNKQYIKLAILIKYCFYVILIQALLVFLLLYSEFGFSIEAFYTRQGLGNEGGTVLNAISISKAGGLLLMFSLYYWILNKSFFLLKFMYASTTLLGLYLLAAGGSRGPMFATIMIILILSLYYLKTNNYLGLFKFSFIVLSLVMISSYFLTQLNINLDDLAFINRVRNTIEGEGDASRSYIWENALNQFKSNIIIGDRFLVRETNYTAHNIFIGSLMSTGLLGSIFLFCAIIIGIIKIALSFSKNIKEHMFFGLVFLFSLISYMVSGAVFIAVEFWAIFAIVLSINSWSNSKKNVESYRYTRAIA